MGDCSFEKGFQTVLKLIEERDRIEAEINNWGEILKRNNVGMHDSLLDNEGFPRNDIDLLEVRYARRDILCLQNDLKRLMAVIEQRLADLHASKLKESSLNPEELDDDMNGRSIVEINFISPDSPAYKAGLKVGDEIIEFGHINKSNFQTLLQIGEFVASQRNLTIPLKIKRGEKTYDLSIIPSIWPGRGLLGCNIIKTEIK